MRKSRKKNVLEKIDDKINDFIDDVKSKKNNKTKNSKKTTHQNSNQRKNNKHEKNTKKRSLWKRILIIILILGISAILALTAFLGYIVLSAPKFNDNDLNYQSQTIIYDLDGNVITTLAIQNQRREIITYDELPQVLIDAIIATEDSRFFQHNGVDLLRFMKATLMQLIGKGDAGGASTITMQTVKNMITKKNESENRFQKIIRKFQDVYLSVFKIEKKYSKEEILENYVNYNYLGGGYYGVKEASKYYFNKDVSDLTLPEAALIAGLFQLPDGNNPYKNIEGASKRRDLVLDYMCMHGYITKEERDITKKVSVESLLAGNNGNKNAFQGYIDTVIEEVEELTGNSPYEVPMLIYTTMERSIQEGIDKIFACDNKNNDCWYWRDDKIQGGVAVINAETGAIAAVGTGRNKTGARQFNYATQAYRQPGSTAKPIFDYGPGIEYNNFSSYTLFNDEPWTYTNGPSVNNWDHKFMGLITARTALQVSRNIPALKAYQQVGGKNSQKFAYSLGLDVAYNSSSENYRILNANTGVDNTINEAYAIGGVAEGFTPLIMASAYASFANGGYYIKPHTITKIEYRNTGEVTEFKYDKERVMKDSTAYIMNNILESATTNGFDGGARVGGSHVATKTGTTNYDEAIIKKHNLPGSAVNDLWTIAYTSKYCTAVWYGYDEVSSTTYNKGDGAKEALTTAVMHFIPKDTVGWKMPNSVVSVEVEKETWPAKLASEYTPADFKTTEYFVRGTQPTEVSERFAKLNDVQNIQTTKSGNSVTLTWDYETPTVLTETYLKQYFSNSVYGKESEKYYNERLKYNTEKLGAIVFGIYKENEDGELVLVDTSAENTYTYTGYGDTTLVVKAEYKNYKANASTGTKVELELDELETSDLTITLKGNSSISVNAGTYTEEGIKKITYGLINVTNTAEVKYFVKTSTSSTSYTTITALENYINSLPAGTYTITYSAKYLDSEATKKRTVIIR